MARSGPGPGILSAIPAGDRKMPEPIVEPTTTAVALQRPIRLGRPVRGEVMAAMLLAGTEWSESDVMS